jgi:hypothetical protein
MRFLCLLLPFFLSASNIVFVHIGKTVPEYAQIAIRQASRLNPDSTVYFLIKSESYKEFSEKHHFSSNVQLVNLDHIRHTMAHKKFNNQCTQDTAFRDGFWRYASERFLYLYDFCKAKNLSNVFHLEYDVMLYINVEDYMPVFKQNYPHIAVTADNDKRVVAGLIYFADVQALQFVAKAMVAGSRGEVNDMVILSKSKKPGKGSYMQNLPIIPSKYSKDNKLTSPEGHVAKRPEEYSNCFHKFNLVFDACAIGQYLGGIDPRNDYGNYHVGFINEMTLFNPSHFTYTWEEEDGLRIPYLTYKGVKSKIANLHIHSKRLELFTSF